MLAQSTSVVTEGARRTKRNRCPTTKVIKTSPAMRKTPGWNQLRPEMIYPPAGERSEGEHDCDDQVLRLRSATARIAASRTSESKNDRIRSPPSISSTKGAKMKKTARAISNCTAEKRRRPNRWAAGSRGSIARAVLFVSVTISLSRRCLNCGHHFDLTNTCRCPSSFSKML